MPVNFICLLLSLDEREVKEKTMFFGNLWPGGGTYVIHSSDSFETGTSVFLNSYFTIKDNSKIAEVTSQSIQLENKTKDTAIK